VRSVDGRDELLVAHNGIEVVRKQRDGEWR